MTRATQLVLRAFVADPSRPMYGLEIGQDAGLASGTIHPILARLEGCGWLESWWEDLGQEAVGRPRRRFYRLTRDGAVSAARALRRAEARETQAAGSTGLPGFAAGLADGRA
jgi:PadR family transcriptional regulator, regulatory protein PadR